MQACAFAVSLAALATTTLNWGIFEAVISQGGRCYICKPSWVANRPTRPVFVTISTFSSNRLSIFFTFHLSYHDMWLSYYKVHLSFIYFLMRSMISPMHTQPSFNLYAVHGYVLPFFSSIWCLMHHTCYASILCTALLITIIHSPRLRVIPYIYSIGRSDTNMYISHD